MVLLTEVDSILAREEKFCFHYLMKSVIMEKSMLKYPSSVVFWISQIQRFNGSTLSRCCQRK